MLTIDSIRQRAARLQQLNLGLCEEVARGRALESPLLGSERAAYLNCIQDGIASLDGAWSVLTTALGRMEKDAAARRGGYVAPAPPRPSVADRYSLRRRSPGRAGRLEGAVGRHGEGGHATGGWPTPDATQVAVPWRE